MQVGEILWWLHCICYFGLCKSSSSARIELPYSVLQNSEGTLSLLSSQVFSAVIRGVLCCVFLSGGFNKFVSMNADFVDTKSQGSKSRRRFLWIKYFY